MKSSYNENYGEGAYDLLANKPQNQEELIGGILLHVCAELPQAWSPFTKYQETTAFGPPIVYPFIEEDPTGQCGPTNFFTMMAEIWGEAVDLQHAKYAEGELYGWVETPEEIPGKLTERDILMLLAEKRIVLLSSHHAWGDAAAGDSNKEWVLDAASHQYAKEIPNFNPDWNIQSVLQGIAHAVPNFEGINQRLPIPPYENASVPNAQSLLYVPKVTIPLETYPMEWMEGRLEELTLNMEDANIAPGATLIGDDGHYIRLTYDWVPQTFNERIRYNRLDPNRG